MSILSALRFDRIPGFKAPEGKVFDDRHGIWIDAPKDKSVRNERTNRNTSPYFDGSALKRTEVPSGFDAEAMGELARLSSTGREMKADLMAMDREIEWFSLVRQQTEQQADLRSPTQELISGTGPKAVRLKRIDEHIAPITKRRAAVVADLTKIEARYATIARRVRAEATKYIEAKLAALAETLAAAQDEHDEIEALTYCCRNAGVVLSKQSPLSEFFTRGGIVEGGAVRWYQHRRTAFLRWRDKVAAMGYVSAAQKEGSNGVSRNG